MMKAIHTHCSECDGLLWSDYSKSEGIHPDCKNPDLDQPLDLEDRLTQALENSVNGIDNQDLTG